MVFGIPEKVPRDDALDFMWFSLKRTVKQKLEAYFYPETGGRIAEGEALEEIPIKFSHNWNGKLRCDYFTTIRGWTPDKEAYYRSHLNGRCGIIIGGTRQHIAVLRSVAVMKYSEVSYLVKLLDTGSETPDEIFKQFKIAGDDPIIILLLKRVLP